MNKIFKSIVFLWILMSSVGADDGQAILESIQKQYESVSTFQAHFVQRAYIKIMDQAQESEGEVSIKKPSKMKWIYNAPDPQILVSNNQTLWLYVPDENQVTKVSIQDIYTTNTPALFLSGRGKFSDSFQVKNVTRNDGVVTVFLTPKKKGQDLKELVLFADNKNYQILGSRVYDILGNKTEIQFSNIEVNLQIPDKQFEFKIPGGVDLLDTTAPSKK